jgi:hypothetical protein
MTGASKVVILGREFFMDSLRNDLTLLDESTIEGISYHLAEIGDIARERLQAGESIESLVRNSDLPRLAAILLLRLRRQTLGWPVDHVANLKSSSDFLRLADKFHATNDSSVVFLFNFLSDVVGLSENPNLLNAKTLDLLKLNLRALSFLATNQVNASTPRDQRPFVVFMHHIWENQDKVDPKISARMFWQKVERFIMSHDSLPSTDEEGWVCYTFEFGLNDSPSQYTAALHISPDHLLKNKIEVKCQSMRRGKKIKSITLKTFETYWSEMRSKFITLTSEYNRT